MTVELGSLVREKWAALLADCFDISQKDAHRVELESSNLDRVVVHDPRGEVEVRAFRPGTEQRYGCPTPAWWEGPTMGGSWRSRSLRCAPNPRSSPGTLSSMRRWRGIRRRRPRHGPSTSPGEVLGPVTGTSRSHQNARYAASRSGWLSVIEELLNAARTL